MKVNTDWICGELFKKVADYLYAPKHKLTDDYDNLINTTNWSALEECNIIYTHTIYVKTLFDIIKHINKKFVIVTHNCDCRIEEFGIVTPNGRSEVSSIDYYTLPDNVIKWFSSNVKVENPRIESLPIGIENRMWRRTPPKKELMVEKLTKEREYKNLLYVNHCIETNVKERVEPYELFKDKSWVTIEKGKNGQKFENYIDNIYNHKFMICPEGNGIGTHRTWECLYLGTIPIEKRSINNSFYTDLPICFVDEWSDINKRFLESEFKRIKGLSWNTYKLTFAYWRDKIVFTKIMFNKNVESKNIPMMNGKIEEKLNMAIEKNKVLMQIGTNNGIDEFNMIAKYASASKIILVEPNKALNDNISINYSGIDNVFIENVAITDVEKGMVKLVIPNYINGKPVTYGDCHYSLLPMDDWGDDFQTLEVPSMTFNDLCTKYGITNIHFLQIDTEGYDVEIIKSIDFKKVSIDIIKFENWGFDENCFKRYGEKSKLYGINALKDVTNLLEYHEYELTDCIRDTLAIKKT
jgi:FkbM family methyltransferase